MPNVTRVEIRGMDKLLRDIEKRWGPRAMKTKSKAVLLSAARDHLVPAVRAEVPPTNPSSPWHGRTNPYARDNLKLKGPMKQTVYAHGLRTRKPNEYAAVEVNIKHYAKAVVVRGGVPHWQPQRKKQHPGSKSNDIFGRGRARGEQGFVAAVLKGIERI